MGSLKNQHNQLFSILFFISGCSILPEQTANAVPSEIDFSTYPIIECEILFSHGSFFGFMPPSKGDTFSFNLRNLEKMKKIAFDKAKLSYIPLPAPLSLEKSISVSSTGYINLRFASKDEADRRLLVDIQRYDTRKPVNSTAWIIHEDHIVQSVAFLNCQFSPATE